MSPRKMFVRSLGAGVVVAIALAVIAYNVENRTLAGVLFWPFSLLVYLIGPGPLLFIDYQGQPHYEGTPLLLFFWPIGVLLSIPVYTLVSYFIFFCLFRRQEEKSNVD